MKYHLYINNQYLRHLYQITMPNRIIVILLLLNSIMSYAQKTTYDIASYIAPAGWTPKEGTGVMSYSKVDGNSWAQIAVYQHRTSEGDIQKDFDKDWQEVVVSVAKGISAPEKSAPQTAEGWIVMSGAGVWQFNGASVASMLTVYSNSKVCVSVLCNATAEPYLKDYQTFIGSFNLDAGSLPATTNNVPTASDNPPVNTDHSSIIGLWCDYTNETSGYVNGTPMYTAGYFRKEYAFNADGTYVYRVKDWLTSMKDILFIYETGTYSISGNQLTITPQQGKGEWWGKQGSSTKEWGGLIKTSEYNLEKVTYAFEIKYYSGSQTTSLILRPGKATAREGDVTHQSEFHYSLRTLQSLIDTPPGFKAIGKN
jgi:hypothetical protein